MEKFHAPVVVHFTISFASIRDLAHLLVSLLLLLLLFCAVTWHVRVERESEWLFFTCL